MNPTPPTIALLHTSLVFIQREPIFHQLIQELMPNVKVIDLIDSQLLPDLLTNRVPLSSLHARFKWLMLGALESSPHLVISLCSSFGSVFDQVVKQLASQSGSTIFMKIDEPMIIRAVGLGSRIGVLATVPTTIAPTCELLRYYANKMEKVLTILPALAEGAFDELLRGNVHLHDSRVLDTAQRLAKEVDGIVCAQASLSRLQEQIEVLTGKMVLTSPRLGIQYAKEILKNQNQII